MDAAVATFLHYEGKLLRRQLNQVGAIRPVAGSPIYTLIVFVEYEMGDETPVVGLAHPAVYGFGHSLFS